MEKFYKSQNPVDDWVDDLRWFTSFLILLNGGKNYHGKSRGTMEQKPEGSSNVNAYVDQATP